MRRKVKYLVTIFICIFCCGITAYAEDELNKPAETAVSLTLSYNVPFPFRVYLPLSYREKGDLPTLYLLHGQGQSEYLWESLGIIELLDNMISSGEIMPMMVIMPKEAYYYQNMDESEFPDKVVNELIPIIDSSFPSIAERRARAIGGISRGALWAQKIAFENMDMFTAVGAHSLPNPFFSDYMVNKYVKQYSEYPPINIYIDTGNLDPYAMGSSDFSAQMFRYKLPHVMIVSPGTHDEDYWSSHLKEYLLWYNDCFSKSEEQSAEN